MPCNDCSRTEQCPPCPAEDPLCRCGHPEERHTTSLPEEGREDYCTECDGEDEKHSFAAEPQGSEPSSTDPSRCEKKGRHCLTHPYGLPNVDGKCCLCGITREELPSEPEECRHPNKYNYGFASGPPGIRYFYCSACKAKWEEAEEPEEPPLTPEEEEEADCPHEFWEAGSQWRDRDSDKWMKSRRCADCRKELVIVVDDEEHASEGPTEDPPCVCGHIAPEHEPDGGLCFEDGCECTKYRTKPDLEAPPQPDRRPPYAVAYSVQGHLYEVALPGDATVRAVDGALVIQHHLGPVAGIVSVLPVINEEAPDGAQADH